MTLPRGFKWLKRARCCQHSRLRTLVQDGLIRLLECAKCRHRWKEVRER